MKLTVSILAGSAIGYHRLGLQVPCIIVRQTASATETPPRKDPSLKTVHVAAGIIRKPDTDEVLAVQRGYGDMEGLWEFPGGKVLRGETAADACRRELLEELDVHVTNLRDFYTVEYDYPDFHLSMKCFYCSLAKEQEPRRCDRQRDIRWVRKRTLAELHWMPADKGLIDELVRLEDVEREADERANGKKPSKLLKDVETADLSCAETELVRRRAAIKKSMKGNKRADTKPEMLVRRRLREAGLTGYRLQWKKAPGRPDIAFPGRKVAIFVNGCFWHRCPYCNPSMPKRNVEFWQAKFKRNTERDARALAELEELGWTAITIWECELKRDRIDATMERVIKTVRKAAKA